MSLPIGQALRQAREAAGLTATEVARRSGVSRRQLAGIETGKGVTVGGHVATLERIAKAIGVSVSAIVNEAEETPCRP